MSWLTKWFEKEEEDPRLILYLRSVKAAEKVAATDRVISMISEVFSGLPVIALGSGESDEWYSQFIKYTRASSLIFVETAITDNLLWQVDFLIQSGQLGKTIFFFSDKYESYFIYKRLRQYFSDHHPNIPLPVMNEWDFDRLPVFLAFEPNPGFLKPKIPVYQYFNIFIYLFRLPPGLKTWYSLKGVAKAMNVQPGIMLIVQSLFFLLLSLFVSFLVIAAGIAFVIILSNRY